jgi:hypothetical protein
VIPATSSPADAFAAFARRWFAALAEHRDAEAVAILDEPNSYGIRWTPKSIRAVIARYGAREITNPETATSKLHSSLLEIPGGYSFDIDVPLDGAWSDLTAQFEFLRRGNDFAVVLHDLHVL